MTSISDPIHIWREVNLLYFLIVTAISLSVFYIAIKTKNYNATRLYLFSIPIWLAIEGFGLTRGVRVYDSPYPLATYFFVAVMEDPGWVVLAYMMTEWFHGKFLSKTNISEKVRFVHRKYG